MNLRNRILTARTTTIRSTSGCDSKKSWSPSVPKTVIANTWCHSKRTNTTTFTEKTHQGSLKQTDQFGSLSCHLSQINKKGKPILLRSFSFLPRRLRRLAQCLLQMWGCSQLPAPKVGTTRILNAARAQGACSSGVLCGGFSFYGASNEIQWLVHWRHAELQRIPYWWSCRTPQEVS